MTLLEILIIFFAIVGTYAALVYILHKKKILQKYNISFYGPMLMWRTTRGVNLLKTLSHKTKFWNKFANAGIILCLIMMIFVTILFISSSWSLLQLTPEQKENLPIGLEYVLAIPGVNPLLPLEYIWYILIGFIVAMVVHEFSHGILSFVSKLKVKSLGILYLIVPLGAFCEPDEKDLQTTKRGNRMRVFAAGPTSNFVVVLITILLFSFIFMGSVHPAADGVQVFSIDADSPAEKIGLERGSIITNINDTEVTNASQYLKVMNKTRPNQTINISYVIGEKNFHTQITLTSEYDELVKINKYNDSFKNVSYSGFYVIIPALNATNYLGYLKNPFSNFPGNFMNIYIIPVYGLNGYNPITSPFTNSYIIKGPLSIIPQEIFWMIVNVLYWIFWINFAVAIFNVLPAVPLDGGYLFKDAINWLVKKIKHDITDEKQEKIANRISLTISLVILFFIIFPLFIRYL